MKDLQPLNIIVADDHEIIRLGVRFMLAQGFNATIFEASNGNELFDLVKKNPCDVVLMDINMPDTDSQSLLQHILSIKKDLNVIMFSMNKEELYGKLYMQLGARGYIQKDALATDLITAIRCVVGGNIYIRKEMQAYYLGTNNVGLSASPFSELSKKELDILPALVKGESILAIAKTFNLSPSTIGTHKAHIFKKLNVSNLMELKEIALLYPIS